MNDYDITDKYGAITILKGIIHVFEKDMNEPKNVTLKGSYEILLDLLKEDYASVQADIFRNFCGTVQNLARVNDDIEEENADDRD